MTSVHAQPQHTRERVVHARRACATRSAPSSAWKIGVFRRRRWRERLVHKERLPLGDDLDARIRAIGADVSAGRRVARG